MASSGPPGPKGRQSADTLQPRQTLPAQESDRETLRRHLQQRSGSSLQSVVDALVDYQGPLKGANTNGTTSAAFAEAIRSFLGAGTITAALDALGASFDGLHLDIGKAEDDVFFADPPFAQLTEYAAVDSPYLSESGLAVAT